VEIARQHARGPFTVHPRAALDLERLAADHERASRGEVWKTVVVRRGRPGPVLDAVAVLALKQRRGVGRYLDVDGGGIPVCRQPGREAFATPRRGSRRPAVHPHPERIGERAGQVEGAARVILLGEQPLAGYVADGEVRHVAVLVTPGRIAVLVAGAVGEAKERQL